MTRLTGASKNTVTKLVVDAGHACTEYQDRVLRNLTSKRMQVDEIWNFVYAEADHIKNAKRVWDGTPVALVAWGVANERPDSRG